MTERWLPVVGYEGLYEVSDHGRVRSLMSRNKPRNVIMTPNLKKGYQRVTLYKNKKSSTWWVHALVLTAFVGPKPSIEMHGCHRDNDRLNNKVGNLRWDTPKGNMQDSHRRYNRFRFHQFDEVTIHIGEYNIRALV